MQGEAVSTVEQQSNNDTWVSERQEEVRSKR